MKEIRVDAGILIDRSDRVFDLIEERDNVGRVLQCPSCNDRSDVKIGIHSRRVTGSDVSFLCNECRHSEGGILDGTEVELFDRWYSQVLFLPMPVDAAGIEFRNHRESTNDRHGIPMSFLKNKKTKYTR